MWENWKHSISDVTIFYNDSIETMQMVWIPSSLQDRIEWWHFVLFMLQNTSRGRCWLWDRNSVRCSAELDYMLWEALLRGQWPDFCVCSLVDIKKSILHRGHENAREKLLPPIFFFFFKKEQKLGTIFISFLCLNEVFLLSVPQAWVERYCWNLPVTNCLL